MKATLLLLEQFVERCKGHLHLLSTAKQTMKMMLHSLMTRPSLEELSKEGVFRACHEIGQKRSQGKKISMENVDKAATTS